MKKIVIIAPVLLVIVGGGMGYKMFLAPKKAEAHHKVEGFLHQLDPEFVVNLAGGRYGKVSVAVLLKDALPPGHNGAAPELHQNAVVRAVITDALTGVDSFDLVTRAQRHKLLTRLTKALRHSTDETIKKVYFTDIAIQ